MSAVTDIRNLIEEGRFDEARAYLDSIQRPLLGPFERQQLEIKLSNALAAAELGAPVAGERPPLVVAPRAKADTKPAPTTEPAQTFQPKAQSPQADKEKPVKIDGLSTSR